MHVHHRDELASRIARGEHHLTEAARRAYVWTQDPDHAALEVLGGLCAAIAAGRGTEAAPAVARRVAELLERHPGHRLLGLFATLLARAIAEGDDALLRSWRTTMASDSLRRDIAALRAAA